MLRSAGTITPSLEDCLRAIFVIGQEKAIVRVKDLSHYLKVKAPSVIQLLRRLEEKDLIVHEHYGHIELTQEGLNRAKELNDRHIVLKQFFSQILGVKEEIAEEDVCRIEHYLSKESVERIVQFVNFIQGQGQDGSGCLNEFQRFVQDRSRKTRQPASRIKLSQLPLNQKAKITKITATGQLKSKLLSLGFTKGQIVSVEKVAPLGSPIDVLIRNSHISLRKQEAERIIVEVL